jgi:hypothetical protein
MPSNPDEFVRGDRRLLERLSHENPEFIVEDATSTAPLPPAASDEAQAFMNLADSAIEQLNLSQEQNGNGNGEDGNTEPSAPDASIKPDPPLGLSD